MCCLRVFLLSKDGKVCGLGFNAGTFSVCIKFFKKVSETNYPSNHGIGSPVVGSRAKNFFRSTLLESDKIYSFFDVI